MSTDASRVIVTTGATPHSTRAHHRDFPEIRAEGKNAAEAAAQLANELTRALDTALTDWRRKSINDAIADVQAYAANPS